MVASGTRRKRQGGKGITNHAKDEKELCKTSILKLEKLIQERDKVGIQPRAHE